MYWADWHHRAVIMTSRMDGSQSEILVENMSSFPTGLSIDAANDRLYFVDKTIKVILLSRRHIYVSSLCYILIGTRIHKIFHMWRRPDKKLEFFLLFFYVYWRNVNTMKC